MIELAFRKWIRTAFNEPSATPSRAETRSVGTSGKPYVAASVAATYCVAAAVAVKEMSMPPQTSTTKRPAASMVVTE